MAYCATFLFGQLLLAMSMINVLILKDCKIHVELIVETINHVMQPVVDAFDPRLLISPPIFHTLDFTRMKVTFCSNYDLL